ncbi:hypothetical protein [Nitratidesulfovibrio oxamicus]|uniref:hypothetical protein n=1 Tax=Nitratidesulfovibrio oxamicus TaxID=32016 RepID=UPI0018C80498|nr:hypothetical protein [Nitratidesulfovibrio oxamicus]
MRFTFAAFVITIFTFLAALPAEAADGQALDAALSAVRAHTDVRSAAWNNRSLPSLLVA